MEQPIYQKFNLKVIKDLLDKRGMTQADLAEKIGRDNTTISRIIRVDRTTTDLLEKIAVALEVDLLVFVDADFYEELHHYKTDSRTAELEIMSLKNQLGNYQKLIDTQERLIEVLEEKIKEHEKGK